MVISFSLQALRENAIPPARLRLSLHTPGSGGLTTLRDSSFNSKSPLTFGNRLLMFSDIELASL